MHTPAKTMLSLLAAISISACSTVTTGTTQTVTLDTPMAEGAKCVLTDVEKRTWHAPSTPASLVVEKGDGPMTVICTKLGYHKTTLVVEEEFAGATLGNILLGGGIGIIVDAASGAAQLYPDSIKVFMRPHQFASANAEAQWNAAKTAWDEAEKARKSPD